MDYNFGDFSKLQIKQYPARDLRETAEGKYWKQFKAPVLSKQFGAVTSIDFCDEYPHDFAITASTRVIIYNGATRTVKRTISRFKDKAYSGSFRQDGKLLVAGGETGIVQVFDTNSRTLLRQLKGHTNNRPVHVTHFSPDRLHVLSAGDDATARWWDVSRGEQISRMTGHADYIRAAACNPASIDVWATGSYDHICKLWDVRSAPSSGGGTSNNSNSNSNSNSKPTMSFDHGAPIESLAFFPSGSLLVTAGGAKLCIWDLYSGGRLLKTLTNHQKTVTSVLVSSSSYGSGSGESSSSSSSPRLLSGSLDGHVKVYDMDTFQVTHASKYPAPVLSLGLSSSNKHLAVGMADGTLSIRRHSGAKRATGSGGGSSSDNVSGSNRREKYKPRLTAASYRYFIRGQSSKAAADDLVVAKKKKAALGQYDRLLRKFRYREALDAALATRRPEIVATVVEELAARGGLRSALADRDDAAGTGMISLLDYLKRAVGDPRHSGLAADLGHRVLDVYGGGRAVVESGGVMEKMEVLRERVKVELQTQDELVKIRGMLEPLLACSVGV